MRSVQHSTSSSSKIPLTAAAPAPRSRSQQQLQLQAPARSLSSASPVACMHGMHSRGKAAGEGEKGRSCWRRGEGEKLLEKAASWPHPRSGAACWSAWAAGETSAWGPAAEGAAWGPAWGRAAWAAAWGALLPASSIFSRPSLSLPVASKRKGGWQAACL